MAMKKGAAVGLIAVAGGLIYLATRGKAAAPGLANLHGIVFDALTGETIPQVLVTLEDEYSTYTNSKGAYSFTDLEPISHYVTFQKEGYEMAAEDIVLQEGDNELNVQMTPIVVLANLSGVVTDADTGLLLSGVSVELWSSDGIDPIASTTTDNNGYYLMEDILPGNYILYFMKTDYETLVK